MNQNKPMVIGLIGGAGTGKTYIGKLLSEKLPGEFIEADIVGHDLLKLVDIKKELVKLFGEEILIDNEISRKILGKLVFNNKKNLEILNKVMHKYMYKKIDSIIRQTKEDYIVLEAAVMAEAKFYELVDYMVEVTTTYEIQLERLIYKRYINIEKAKAILEIQRYRQNIVIDDRIDTTFDDEELDKLLERLRRYRHEKFI